MGCGSFFALSVLVAIVSIGWQFSKMPYYLDDADVSVRLLLSAVHPLRKYLTLGGELTGIPAVSAINVTRFLYSQISLTQRDYSSLQVKIVEESFDGVPTRLYIPPNAKPNGAAVFNIHGGGWLFFTAPDYDEFCSRLAHALGVVVANVEYRLAPEHKYPAPLDDCETSFRFFAKNAAKWKVDAKRISVIGDSCGGNLAAALAIRLKRKATEEKIKFLTLFYPLLQIHNLSTITYRTNEQDYLVPHSGLSIPIAFHALGNSVPENLQKAGYPHMYAIVSAVEANNHSRSVRTMSKVKKILTDDIYEAVTSERDRKLLAELPQSTAATVEQENRVEELTGKEKLLNDIFEPFILDPEMAPLLAPSLEGYPTTYFGLVGHDNLNHDGRMFAERLKRANVKVHIKEYPNRYHPYAFFQPEEMIEDLRKFVEEQSVL